MHRFPRHQITFTLLSLGLPPIWVCRCRLSLSSPLVVVMCRLSWSSVVVAGRRRLSSSSPPRVVALQSSRRCSAPGREGRPAPLGKGVHVSMDLNGPPPNPPPPVSGTSVRRGFPEPACGHSACDGDRNCLSAKSLAVQSRSAGRLSHFSLSR